MSFGDAGLDVEGDVDMSDEVELVRSDERPIEQYVVVDTNILIHDFALVQALHVILSLPTLASRIHLLIPSIVIHELDNIQKSDRVEIRNQAREAMRFLLRLVKLRRDDPMIPLRIQKQSECLNLHSGKPDDKILDCCLFFGPNCGRIWLWTKDLNLNVKAESNDVRMLDRYSLGHIVKCLGLSDVQEVREVVRTESARHASSTVLQENLQDDDESGGMDFDIDLHQGLPSFDVGDEPVGSPTAVLQSPRSNGPRTLLDDYLARYSPQPSESDTPMSPRLLPTSPPVSSTSSTPLQSSIFDHQDNLFIALQPLLSHLNVVAYRTDRYLTALLTRLDSIEQTVDTGIAARQPPTDEQRTLLVGISAIRTLVRFFERDMFDRTRRPRTGEVADCIDTLAEICDALGLPDSTGRNLRLVATLIRA